MYRIHWEKLFAVLFLLFLPVILTWLNRHISIGNFAQIPVLGLACEYTEAKALILWAILLATVVLTVRTIKT